jgi:hypothetical protein
MLHNGQNKLVGMSRIIEIHYEPKHYLKSSRLHIYKCCNTIFPTKISKFHPDLVRSDELTRISCVTAHAAPQ